MEDQITLRDQLMIEMLKINMQRHSFIAYPMPIRVRQCYEEADVILSIRRSIMDAEKKEPIRSALMNHLKEVLSNMTDEEAKKASDDAKRIVEEADKKAQEYIKMADEALERRKNESVKTPTPKSIQQRVKEVVRDQLNVNIDTINLSTSFMDDLDADSIDLVELGMAFEEEFKEELGGEIPENDMLTLTTVGKVNDYIRSIDYLRKKNKERAQTQSHPNFMKNYEDDEKKRTQS